ncbi:SDR family NAD(P)-dependent oxidoreductase [Streptomyces sp. NPDC058848]|uniref:type I polyketide synthase n=1 Tax=unclassified Streptomyces TaxID=2593676 RepID=UPI003674EA7B
MNAMDAHGHGEPIAVVGMAGRFPGAPDADALWSLLIEGKDAIGPVPEDRWDTTAPLDPEREIQAVGGFLDGVDLFDAEFFGVSPREAAAIDPQQRLLLEVAWRALEDAGQPAAALAGSRTGVYVGASWHDYELLRMAHGARPTPHSLPGNALDVIAARLSYFLGLRGPSMTVETGCSSSLVALHLAVQALRQGEIDAAVVGGTNLMLDPHVTVGLTHFGALSPDGRCATFSARANGFVRGECVAALHLKTLGRALADGDRIHGLVLRTVVNNDGGGDSLVTPSLDGQIDLLDRAYGDGIVPAGALSYIEAHGTGTGRGDPIETTAIGRVLGRDRTGDPLLIGSVKTNIGHLEAGAGLAGLFKLLLALRHRAVPPSLHSEELNPEIPFGDLGLSVVREPVELPADGPLYMGVNSFGWGGTNAHTVVTGPPPAQLPEEPRPARRTGLPLVVPLSAKQAPALARRAAELADALAAPADHARTPAHPRDDDARLPAVAGTLAWRRDHFPVRAALPASRTGELQAPLEAVAAASDPEQEIAGAVTGRAVPRGRTVFVFPGQGSQWSGMGRDLYRHSPHFADVIGRCANALRPHVDWDLRAIFAGEADDTWMTRIDMLQPTLWAMSLGLAELWRASGVEPDVVLGHSQGEITAATLAGILSYEDAALVMARRSAIARKTSGRGRMLAVDLDRDAALEALAGFEDTVALAVHNGPRSCVLSGDEQDVLDLKELLEAEDVYCRLVNVDYASHSPQMDPLRDDLLTALAPARPRAGSIPLMSTVRVAPVDGPEMDAAYWTENLRRPVLFADAMSRLFDEGVTHVVEISPHPVLAPAVEQLAAARLEPPVVLPTLRRHHGTPDDMARALARAYVTGLEPFGELPRHHTTTVPGYPLRPDRHWIPPRTGRSGAAPGFAPQLTPAPGERGSWTGQVELSVTDLPWLADHEVYGTAVLPGAAMLTLAVNAVLARTGSTPARLHDIAFRKEIALTGNGTRLTAEWRDYGSGPAAARTGTFRLLALPEGATDWETSMTAQADATAERRATAPAAPPFPDWHTGTDPVPADTFYRACAERGLDYGPAFQGVRRLYTHPSGRQTLGEVVLDDRLHAGNRPHVLHPALWDGALQVSLPLHDGPRAVVPTGVRQVWLPATPEEPVTTVWSHAVRRDDGLVDLCLYDAGRRPLALMEGLELRQLPGAAGTGPDDARLHHLAWTDITAPDQAGQAAETADAGHWLVCGPGGRRTEALVAALTAAGARPEHHDTGGWDEPAAVTPALDGTAAPDGVLFLAPPADTPDAARRGLLALSHLARACADLGTTPRLCVLTRLAQAATADDLPDSDAALYWGFTRTLRREHGELEPRLVDVDDSDPDWATACAGLLLHGPGTEDQLALRRGRLFAARLTRGLPAEEAGGTLPVPRTPRQPFRVARASRPGRAGDVRCIPLTRRDPGPGEIEIEVAAGALADPELAGPDRLAAECAGRVTAVGPGVSGLSVGDRVAACAPDALASHVTVRADHARPVPDDLDDARAATLPLTMAAAWYALHDLAHVEPEDTVLIHAAAGGIGHAALGIARALGARVLVTADSEAGRRLLRDRGLTDVFDCADPSWASEVRAATAGRGVDLVLNTLPGDAVTLGLGVLAEGGRFVHVGRADAQAGRRLGLEALGRGVSLLAVEPLDLPRSRPERFARALRAVWELVIADKLEAQEVQGMPFAAAGEALRLLTDGDRTGRICLTDPHTVHQVVAEPLPGGRLRPDGTYLVTGGLGALGLSLAEYFAEHGARTLVLLGRSGPRPEAEPRLAALRERGVTVHTPACDVSDAAALHAALDAVRAELPPLRGVVHAAGLLADATVRNLTGQQLAAVLAPKTTGARLLDAATEQDPLDFFVLFSSAAALVGNAGQAAYAAANAGLDALAESRRRRGLPALSVQWGPFSDVGLAATDERRGARLEERGMGGFPTHEAWQALLRLLERDTPVAGYVPINARQWFDAYPDTAALGSWQRLRAAAEDAGAAQGGEFLARLLDTPAEERAELVEGRVRELSGRVLRLDAARIDRDTPFKALGLDSLMSLELRNRLEAVFGLRLSPTVLWAYGSPKALSAYLCEQLAPAPDGT